VRLRTLGAALVAGACFISFTSAVSAAPPTEPGADKSASSCGSRVNNTIAKLVECVTLDSVRAHQAAFQEIADANGGTRASSTPGYDASVQYVVDTLIAAGYEPVVQPFDYVVFTEVTEATLEQVAPVPTTYTYLEDFYTMSYSGSGSVTAPVTPVDIQLGLGNTSTSGCDEADFAGFPAGNIALIQRGSCDFVVKVLNAEAAGADGVIIFNQGNTADADRQDLFGGTLGGAYTGDLPVLSMPYDLGAELSTVAGLVMSIGTDTTRVPESSFNVFAETTSGDPANTVMVGAHLDSVLEGPGINDNGSGSAAILETAVQLAKTPLKNQVRFAWWGAEESGLVGSTHYIDDLIAKYFATGDPTILQIAMYLNFDMIGSPNYVFKIYDGDDSDGEGEGPGPAGSVAIEAFFEDFYDSVGEPYKGTDFSGRSDYGPFIEIGIPAGGLFTGAEEIKTPEEEAIWGGTAGEQLDPCYHAACDTYDNVSLHALDVNADAVAAATLYFGMNTSDVNGVAGKGNFVNGSALDKVDPLEPATPD
jgi:Zn-dependent M28 family amino/carboxypeptidase